jgi:hypothetical protein
MAADILEVSREFIFKRERDPSGSLEADVRGVPKCQEREGREDAALSQTSLNSRDSKERLSS